MDASDRIAALGALIEAARKQPAPSVELLAALAKCGALDETIKEKGDR